MLTWNQRFQRWTKKQKKLATKHAAVALAITLFLMAVLHFFDFPPTVKAAKDPEAVLTVTAVGDMMFGRHIQDVIDRKGYDYLFQYVRTYFRSSDFVTGNFENPIVSREISVPRTRKHIQLKADPGAAEFLKREGFTVVSLANNHLMDYGKRGLLDTLDAFRKAGVDVVGAGSNINRAKRISYKTVSGIKIATIGISDVMPIGIRARATTKLSGVAPADPDVFFPLVAKADNNADLVIVHIHWGLEYDSGFHPRQRDLAYALADAGADIIVGHHPHVLEPVEVYKDTVIFYSLGNFIFDQGWSRTKESVIAQYKLYPDGKARIEMTPLIIRGGQPRPLTGAWNAYRREKIFAQISQEMLYTSNWSNTWKRDGEKIVREFDHSRVIKDVKERDEE
jgi:poly-gamma-glutamate synthesis protein (capsule biosynthesis protein)